MEDVATLDVDINFIILALKTFKALICGPTPRVAGPEDPAGVHHMVHCVLLAPTLQCSAAAVALVARRPKTVLDSPDMS